MQGVAGLDIKVAKKMTMTMAELEGGTGRRRGIEKRPSVSPTGGPEEDKGMRPFIPACPFQRKHDLNLMWERGRK